VLLIDDLLLLPFKGLFGIFRKIQEMAERELSDEGYMRERLMELQLKFELDEISEEEYTRQEKAIMARLDSIRGAEEEREEA
jgi:hypothetical protein